MEFILVILNTKQDQLILNSKVTFFVYY